MVMIKIDDLPTPEYLAMVAMIESGVYDKEEFSRTQHWNNPDDEVHKFWEKFTEYLKFYGYKIEKGRE